MLQGSGDTADQVEEKATLRIGQLADLAAVNVETLRYYEREGLLDKPYQHLSGYRAYPVSAVTHVQSIKRAQALGFSLAEIRGLLKEGRRERFSSEATRKLAEIDGTLADLQRARADLVRLVEYGCDGLSGCTCGRPDCPTKVGSLLTPVVQEAPIVCSLSAADLGDREAEWRALLDRSLVRGERIASGVRVTVRPEASGELHRLIDLERACCAWMKFEFSALETVAITAPADGVDALVAMFLRLDPSGSSQGDEALA